MSGEAKAMQPEDERLNAGDAAGVAALDEPEAVLAPEPAMTRRSGHSGAPVPLCPRGLRREAMAAAARQ